MTVICQYCRKSLNGVDSCNCKKNVVDEVIWDRGKRIRLNRRKRREKLKKEYLNNINKK